MVSVRRPTWAAREEAWTADADINGEGQAKTRRQACGERSPPPPEAVRDRGARGRQPGSRAAAAAGGGRAQRRGKRRSCQPRPAAGQRRGTRDAARLAGMAARVTDQARGNTTAVRGASVARRVTNQAGGLGRHVARWDGSARTERNEAGAL